MLALMLKVYLQAFPTFAVHIFNLDLRFVNLLLCNPYFRLYLFHIRLKFSRGIEDPLDDMGSVKQTMELFTIIARRNYKRTTEELIGHFDTNLSVLFNSASNEQVWKFWILSVFCICKVDFNLQEISIAKKRLIWIITLMAAGYCFYSLCATLFYWR
jgi:hypothetical protein